MMLAFVLLKGQEVGGQGGESESGNLVIKCEPLLNLAKSVIPRPCDPDICRLQFML